MKLRSTLLLTVLCALHPLATLSAREGTEWVTAYWYNANDSRLPRVLLIGDSIVKGYQEGVRDQLAGSAYLAYYATSKSVSDRSYLKELAFILEEYDYAAIVFNNGLHSLEENPETWAASLEKALELIQEKGKGATILWATSTPLKDPALTAKAEQLNTAAAKIMASKGIATVDLFALMNPLDRGSHWADTYHFNKEGTRMQTQAIADALRGSLDLKTASTTEVKESLQRAASETGPDGRITTTSGEDGVLRNPGFEHKEGWTTYPPEAASAIQLSSDSPHAGEQCLKISAGPNGVQVYQNAPVFPPGCTAEISFWARSSQPGEMRGSLRSRKPPYRFHGIQTFATSDTWQQYSFEVKVPEDYIPEDNGLYFDFVLEGDYDIDEITVQIR